MILTVAVYLVILVSSSYWEWVQSLAVILTASCLLVVILTVDFLALFCQIVYEY